VEKNQHETKKSSLLAKAKSKKGRFGGERLERIRWRKVAVGEKDRSGGKGREEGKDGIRKKTLPLLLRKGGGGTTKFEKIHLTQLR